MENATADTKVEETTAEGPSQHIKGVVESLLFVNERPITIEQIKKVLETVTAGEIKKAISDLRTEYEGRMGGMMVVEIAGGYQMLSNPIYASYLRSFYKTKHKEKLSKPALECMAIIAYKQPVTRADIEVIRGVNSDGVTTHLLEKELIKVIGRKDVPGRPYVYGTTKLFLEYFGLKSLDDLPTLEEFPNLEPSGEVDILPLTDEEKGDDAALSDGETEAMAEGDTAGEDPDASDETNNGEDTSDEQEKNES